MVDASVAESPGEEPPVVALPPTHASTSGGPRLRQKKVISHPKKQATSVKRKEGASAEAGGPSSRKEGASVEAGDPSSKRSRASILRRSAATPFFSEKDAFSLGKRALKIDEKSWKGVIDYYFDPCRGELGGSAVARQLGRAIYSHELNYLLKKLPVHRLPNAVMQQMAGSWQTVVELTRQFDNLAGEVERLSDLNQSLSRDLEVGLSHRASLKKQNVLLKTQLDEAQLEMAYLRAASSVAGASYSMSEVKKCADAFRRGCEFVLGELVKMNVLPDVWTFEHFSRQVDVARRQVAGGVLSSDSNSSDDDSL